MASRRPKSTLGILADPETDEVPGKETLLHFFVFFVHMD